MKYYFISYVYHDAGVSFKDAVINEHPFEWKRWKSVALISWQEITAEEYNNYRSY